MQTPKTIREMKRKNLIALNVRSYPSSSLGSNSSLVWPHIQNIKKIKNKDITKNRNATNPINSSINKFCHNCLELSYEHIRDRNKSYQHLMTSTNTKK